MSKTIKIDNIIYKVDDTVAVVCGHDNDKTIITAHILSEVEGKPVKRVAASTFFNCACLKSITIPDSVTEIDEYAFSGCQNLKQVVLPRNLKSIGFEAFCDCNSLESITIPDGVERIGLEANRIIGKTKIHWI